MNSRDFCSFINFVYLLFTSDFIERNGFDLYFKDFTLSFYIFVAWFFFVSKPNFVTIEISINQSAFFQLCCCRFPSYPVRMKTDSNIITTKHYQNTILPVLSNEFFFDNNFNSKGHKTSLACKPYLKLKDQVDSNLNTIESWRQSAQPEGPTVSELMITNILSQDWNSLKCPMTVPLDSA